MFDGEIMKKKHRKKLEKYFRSKQTRKELADKFVFERTAHGKFEEVALADILVFGDTAKILFKYSKTWKKARKEAKNGAFKWWFKKYSLNALNNRVNHKAMVAFFKTEFGKDIEQLEIDADEKYGFEITVRKKEK